MKLPLATLALPIVALACCFAATPAQGAGKAPDVMTVNGAQVPAPAAVPDLTSPPRAIAPRPALDPAATPPPPKPAPRHAKAAAAPAGSVPALLGPLPRPAWTAAGTPTAPPAPKPVDTVTIGEPTGLETSPAAIAPRATAPANPAAKRQRDVTTSAPRDPSAPAPSPAKAEVKR